MNIKTNSGYTDERGKISMILESCDIKSISRITCHSNSTRASHWHRNDGHWILINFGVLEYYERPVGTEKVTRIILREGDMLFTGPNIEHEMYTPIFCEFDCYSLLPRNSENYENETVRFAHSLKNLYALQNPMYASK